MVCSICDGKLPERREDYMCEECRRRRIVDHRDTRPRIGLMPIPVEFSQKAT